MEPHYLALPVGFQIEHFRIEAVLGKGGFGITYLAVDLQLGKRVAIKELLPDTIATRVEGLTVVPHSHGMQENWEWARERFLEEARTLATFSHPAIVGVHRLLEANGTVYMVMDYVEGESYEARLHRIGTEPDQATLMAVIGPILSGLEEVHSHGLLHRDIKPENILIDRRGQPSLIDFGSARESVGKTMTMTSIVTHGYSPIEQYQTQGRMGPWTDIYAMGALICRAMTGEKPPVAADRVLDDGFSWLSYMRLPGYHETFKKSVDWALKVRPEERPQSVKSWAAQLSSTTNPADLTPSRSVDARPREMAQEPEHAVEGHSKDSHGAQTAKTGKWWNAERKLDPGLVAVAGFIALGGLVLVAGFLNNHLGEKSMAEATDTPVFDPSQPFDVIEQGDKTALAPPKVANILALDLSRSMLAEDFRRGEARQSRLEAVRSAARRFVQDAGDVSIGVVGFAGQPFVALEPTRDRTDLLKVLKDVRIGAVEDGTAIGSAVLSGCRQLRDADSALKMITLITDGDNNSGSVNPLTAAHAALQLGIRVNVIATGGLESTAPFPVQGNNGVISYRNVPTTINEESLRQLARSTGGKYARARTVEELERAFAEIERGLASSNSATDEPAHDSWFTLQQAERLLEWTRYEDQKVDVSG